MAGCVEGTSSSLWLDAGGEGEACDGEAHHLALTAAKTANRVAHEEDFGEIFGAQSGTAEGLAGAELTLDRNSLARLSSKVRDTVFRSAGPVSAAGLLAELIFESHR
jgi:hypothetical protein